MWTKQAFSSFTHESSCGESGKRKATFNTWTWVTTQLLQDHVPLNEGPQGLSPYHGFNEPLLSASCLHVVGIKKEQWAWMWFRHLNKICAIKELHAWERLLELCLTAFEGTTFYTFSPVCEILTSKLTPKEDLLELKLKTAIFKQVLYILFFINKEKSDSIFIQNNINFDLNPAFAMDFWVQILTLPLAICDHCYFNKNPGSVFVPTIEYKLLIIQGYDKVEVRWCC